MLYKRWARKGMLLILALAMLMSTAILAGATTVTGGVASEDTTQEEPAWKENVLARNPLNVMIKHRDEIASVTFLDTLEDAPRWTWHLGPRGAKDKVQGWIKWEEGLGHVYIAAEGGVNGKKVCAELFKECTTLTKVHFNGAFHTDDATSMVNMFYKCYNLKEVDLETLNTSNVTSMFQMFRNCASLETLDLSKMDTSKVETMYCMFSTCRKLKELDLSSFNTAKVTNMGYMFSACSALEKVDVSSFDTSKVSNMEGMFRWCGALEEYDFSGWNVSGVKKYAGFLNSGMQINGQQWETFFEEAALK